MDPGGGCGDLSEDPRRREEPDFVQKKWKRAKVSSVQTWEKPLCGGGESRSQEVEGPVFPDSLYHGGRHGTRDFVCGVRDLSAV